MEESFGSTGSGLNGKVSSIAKDSTGRIWAGGNFSNYNRIVRLNNDGSLNLDFQIGAGQGPNDEVTKIIVQNDDKVIVMGKFTTFNGVARNGIVRLETDGTVDTSFNPGLGVQGGEIYDAFLEFFGGKILVAGTFSGYDGTQKQALARINIDGSLDTSFNSGNIVPSISTGSPTNQYVYTLARIGFNDTLIGGGFTTTCTFRYKFKSDTTWRNLSSAVAYNTTTGCTATLLTANQLLWNVDFEITAVTTSGATSKNYLLYSNYDFKAGSIGVTSIGGSGL